jgi:Domain of unknown function (DUF3472)
MRQVAMLALVLSIIGLGIGTLPAPARAAQHQNANIYVYWSFPTADGTGFAQNVDQEILIPRKAAATYWAQVWKWSDDPTIGGYIGLQTNGNRSDGSTGDTVNFSLWNSIAAMGPNKNSCQRNGEAAGFNCASAYTIKEDVWYRLRVWKGQLDPDGQWWAGYVENENTGVDTWVGSIKVAPTHQAMTSVQDFSEYFGPQVACNQVPMSIADFTQPAANLLGNGAYQYYSSYSRFTKASCTGGSVEVVSEHETNAARVTLGG